MANSADHLQPLARYHSFAISVRISCKCYSNRATFPPHENLSFPTAYNLRTKSAKSTGSERIGRRREILGLFPPWPVNRSALKTPGILPKRGKFGPAERADHFETGGAVGTGIQPSLVFVRRVSPAGSPRPVCWIFAVPVPEIGQRLDDPTLTDDAALATRRHTLKLRTQRRETP